MPLSKATVTLLFFAIGFAKASVNNAINVLDFEKDSSGERRLQQANTSYWSWGSFYPVCVMDGDVYVTRYMRRVTWWFYSATGLWQGSFGACEDLCPCGEFGVCTALSPEYQCECDDGYVFDGVSCVMDDMGDDAGDDAGDDVGDDTGDDAGDDGDDPDVPTYCDGYYYRCPSGYVCTDDPESSCTIAGGCWGICALSCGGFRPEPVVCPDGTECVDDPADGCAPPFIADCPGVCLPKNDDPVDPPDAPDYCDDYYYTCPEGYSCVDNPDDCTRWDGCWGICSLACGGFTLDPVTCPNGQQCVDNPYTCSQAVDCQGVCV